MNRRPSSGALVAHLSGGRNTVSSSRQGSGIVKRAAAIVVGLLMVMTTVVNVSANVGTVTVNNATQNPNPVVPGGQATFTVGVNNTSGGTIRAFNATLITGATGVSLAATDCVSIGPGATGSVHIVVATTTATPVGSDAFTVTLADYNALDCSGATQNTNTVTRNYTSP